MTQRALVLAGGGVAGISWETGIIIGLADVGVHLRNAELVIGTSAGSCVGAQILSDLSNEELFQRQVDSALQAKEIPASVSFEQLGAQLLEIQAAATDTTDLLRRIGAAALAAQTVTEAARREVLVSRLPSTSWPARPLKITAVDTATGERRVFDATSGVDLTDATAASCAVPGVWPPVTIGGSRYMDGGVYSTENADLAAGCDLAVILTPNMSASPIHPLPAVVAELERGGTRVAIIQFDDAINAVIASFGGNALDPAIREPAAKAGREQGRREAAKIAALWG